jgi:hypothetical protein
MLPANVATGVFPKQQVLKSIDTTFPVYRVSMPVLPHRPVGLLQPLLAALGGIDVPCMILVKRKMLILDY